MNYLNQTRRLTRLSILITFALILSYIETLIPAMPIPGAKIGLANIISLIALISMSYVDALIIIVSRTTLSALLFTSFSALLYAMPAGVVSLTVMLIVLKLVKDKQAFITVSLVGALAHNLTQLFVAVIILKTFSMAYLLPWMIILAIPTGLSIGILAKYIMRHTSKGL